MAAPPRAPSRAPIAALVTLLVQLPSPLASSSSSTTPSLPSQLYRCHARRRPVRRERQRWLATIRGGDGKRDLFKEKGDGNLLDRMAKDFSAESARNREKTESLLKHDMMRFRSFDSYAAFERKQARLDEIQRQKVTLESEVFAELRRAPELAEVYKDSLLYRLRKEKWRVQEITETTLESILSEAMKPEIPSKKLIMAMWDRFCDAKDDFFTCQRTGRPHRRIIRESQRGISDESSRKKPPDTDVFAARLLVQRMLAQRDQEATQAQRKPLSERKREEKKEYDTRPPVEIETGDSNRHRNRDGEPPIFQNAELSVVKAGDPDAISTVRIGHKRTVTLGRQKEGVDVLALHPSVSRHHATFTHDAKTGIFVTDEGTNHGTFVNKKKISPRVPHLLHEGDIITVGRSTRMYILSYNGDTPVTQRGEKPQHFVDR